MVSERAKRIAHAILTTDADQPSAEAAIDAELAEVLERLLEVTKDRSGEAPLMRSGEWERARALYDKLTSRLTRT